MITLTFPAVMEGQYGSSNPWPAAAVQHQHQRVYAQPNGTAGVTERRAIHRAYAVGTVVAVRAGIVTPCVGAATLAVDVLKNGTSILSAPVSVGSSAAAFAAIAGAIATAGYAVGDVFETSVTATAGGGTLGQGLTVDVVFRENPQ